MFQKDIEILTVNGWKGFGSLEGELVHEFLPSTNSITLSPVEKVWSEPFKGKLRGILGERPSRGIIATSDHKTIIYPKYHMERDEVVEWKTLTMEALSHHNKMQGYIPLTGLWTENPYIPFTMEDKLHIALATIGVVCKDQVFVAPFLSHQYDRLIFMLDYLNIPYTEGYEIQGLRTVTVDYPTEEGFNDLSFIKFDRGSYLYYKEVLNEFLYWKGETNNLKRNYYDFRENKLLSTIQVIALLSGTILNPKASRRRLVVSDFDRTFTPVSLIKVEIPYDDLVYGVSIPSNGFLFCRNNLNTFIAGGY